MMVRKTMLGDFRCLQEETLPHHLVFEQILPRLPVKSLIRFKSVSKDWHSLISTPEFMKSHLQFSAIRRNFLIMNEKDVLSMLPYDEHSLKELVELDTRLVPPMILCFIGCCNGLVCLYHVVNRNGFFAVWNPATHQYRRINYPNGKRVAVIHAFGYASLIDDFKIVAAFICADDGKNDLYVFSLRSGNWRRICRLQDYSIAETKDHVVGLFADDAVYWSFIRLWGEPSCILGFNLVSEQFKEVPKLNCVGEYSMCRHAIKGCLAVCCDLDVWILKLNGDSCSWEKLFSLHHSLKGWYCYAVSLTGKCLIRHLGQLKLVDPNEEAPEGNSIFNPIMDVVHYVEGLFSPFETTKYGKEEKNDVNKYKKRGNPAMVHRVT